MVLELSFSTCSQEMRFLPLCLSFFPGAGDKAAGFGPKWLRFLLEELSLQKGRSSCFHKNVH